MPTQTRQRSNIVEGTAAAAFCCGSPGGAARRIALQLPERTVTIHIIRTDDPIGIEAYWHKRFEAKRANGEWFALTTADVQAFERRKTFM